jgi:Flp pilus assembly protein TadD
VTESARVEETLSHSAEPWLYPLLRVNYALVILRAPHQAKPDDILRANHILTEVVEKWSDFPEGWSAYGIVKSVLNDTRAARDAWYRALELKPNYAEIFANLGALAAHEGDWRGAEQLFRRGLEIRDDLPVLWINLSIARANQDDLAGAEDAYLMATRLAPNNSALWRCPFQLGRRTEAAWIRLESTRLRIQMLEATPPDVLAMTPDRQFYELW